jgi:hypothetical protein
MIILYLIFTQKKDYIDTHNPIGVGANKQKNPRSDTKG